MMDLQNISEQQKRYILIAGGVIIVIALLIFIKIPKSTSSSLDDFTITSEEVEEEVEKTSQENYFIEISGNVERPGIYELNEEIMVLELIGIAGGISEGADIKHIHKDLNLSEVVVPGQKVYIPAVAEKISGSSTADGLVSINTGLLEDLMSLDGVGESTANKIISARPYESLDDLMDVSGIGEVTYNNIVPRISL